MRFLSLCLQSKTLIRVVQIRPFETAVFEILIVNLEILSLHCQWNFSSRIALWKTPQNRTTFEPKKILGVRKLKLLNILSVTRLLVWTRTLWRLK